jgi:hypothetical protein
VKYAREDLAWLAGFFDGEGCCRSYVNHGRYSIQISVTQAHPEVLERCKRITGLGSVVGPYPTKNKPLYYWRIYGFEKVQAVIALMWDWLGTQKREQAEEALSLEGKKPNALL